MVAPGFTWQMGRITVWVMAMLAGAAAPRDGVGFFEALEVVEGEDFGLRPPPGGGGAVFEDDFDGLLGEGRPGGLAVAGAGGSAHDEAGAGSGAVVGELFVGGLVEDVVGGGLEAGGAPGLLLDVGFLVSPIEGSIDALRGDEALACFDGSGEQAVFGEGVGGDLPRGALEGGEEVFLAGSGIVEEPGDAGHGGPW